MGFGPRDEQILAAVERQGFASVRELSDLLRVSEVTVRRALDQLERAGRLRRTHGGALALRPVRDVDRPASAASLPEHRSLADRVDVLITTPVDPSFDRALLERAAARGIPVIAESVGMPGAATLVATDNYQAAAALGRWAGAYAAEHFAGDARVLDLTYDLPNTRARSQGFLAGLRQVTPNSRLALSLNAGSTRQTARQLTRDVLDVHPEINLIFAINDTTACGAIQGCREHGSAPDALVVLTYGLEGDTLRNSLVTCTFCRAALAMFPEIVGPTCVEAAILAYNGRPLPAQLVTPHAVVTPETLAQFYGREGQGWSLRWDGVVQQLALPLPLRAGRQSNSIGRPARIGFVVPFSEHEWYRNLAACMQAYAAGLGIDLEVVDAERDREADLTMRRRAIARLAAEGIGPGEVILIDGGQVTTYLAEALAGRENVTIITNSVSVFEALRDRSAITLILIGGVFRPDSGVLSGPTAEAALRELRADKLFLTAAGLSLEFGLSHSNVAQVAIKQAMIRAAREVIVLADHTTFGQESVAQVAPLQIISRLITDNALPASTRLELSKLGIDVMIART